MTTCPDEIDKSLINRLQDDLPLETRPFAAIGRELGLSEEEVLQRVHRLKEDGILTRFGPFFDAAALGGAFCLCAMSVPAVQFDAVMTKVNAHPEVAHNYEREHALNMWFVLATESAGEIASVARRIEAETGLEVLLFPKEREFFIGFRVAA
ncbi:AsnC family transcriptional regulator [Aliiruegeria haliotis]|uniref:Siroheme decarboxylase NirG subunit n=1 Tax=Aliiruegeria haliotis TaxID=1280846 RepID=A0A2T0RL67_9RHOB|nr:AsnC family transcriptional regulator [Aliiruegeria haliotis]PRY21872.1 AsnC family transcriptional regulator [Aliiruegeria haliotis]